MTTVLIILCATLAHFLIGSLYLVAYVLVYRPQPADAQLGLTVLFWPIYITVEAVLALAYQVGRFGKATAAKIEGKPGETTVFANGHIVEEKVI